MILLVLGTDLLSAYGPGQNVDANESLVCGPSKLERNFE